MKIGEKIRRLRQEKDMTLEELSKKSGVALATLSRMETGKMTGTVDSHNNICRALNVSIADLYREAEDESKTVERMAVSTRPQHYTQSSRAKFELLVSETHGKKILPLLVRISPGGATKKEETSPGIEKFIYVLNGDIEVRVGKQDFVLKKGDSLYFDASLPHVFANKKGKEAQALCIVSPPQL